MCNSFLEEFLVIFGFDLSTFKLLIALWTVRLQIELDGEMLTRLNFWTSVCRVSRPVPEAKLLLFLSSRAYGSSCPPCAMKLYGTTREEWSHHPLVPATS